jgi:hypothetical protein
VAVELALALSGLTAQAIVTQLVQGSPFDRNGWANVAGQIVKAMIDTSQAQESTLRQLGQKIDDIPLREYERHMAAGRRYLREVNPQWRTERDRRDMIRDARSEFVRASAVAEVRNDLLRQVTAEVAIAGCWLWVPSLSDVKNTITNARTVLEREVLYGATLPAGNFKPAPPSAAAYADVVALARGYGEQPHNTGEPIKDSPLTFKHRHGARLAVLAAQSSFVTCAGVQLRLDAQQAATLDYVGAQAARGIEGDDGVTVTIHNTRDEWVAVSRNREAVIVTLPTNGTLPPENRVAPYSQATLALPRNVHYTTDRPAGTIGFVLPKTYTRLKVAQEEHR